MNFIQAYEEAVIHLIKTKPFYAKVIMSAKKEFNTLVPTCGVSVQSTGIKLYINPIFFNIISMKERAAVLEHEVLHLLHGHFARFGNFQTKDKMIANVACDIAINQYLPNIPKSFEVPLPDGTTRTGHPVTYEDLLKEIPDLMPHMSSEYYFNKLKKLQKEMGEGSTVDDHSQWEKSDLTDEQKSRLMKKHMKALLDGCSDEEKSTIDKAIIDEIYKSDIDWKQQLRSFMANSEETFTVHTRKKRNKRFGIYQPGTTSESKLKLVVAVDTSGSVSTEWLNMIFGEIDRMFDDSKMELYVIEADCQIHTVYKYKKNMKITAKGRGGTAYIPAFNKAKELGADAFIYCGDMDTSDVPEKPKFPVLWAIVGSQKPPVDFGRSIYIK